MSSRDSDASLWLHNKLGSTDDLWSGSTISSQLTQERLSSIQQCFHTLQPHVKVKLMLSFIHLRQRNLEELHMEIEMILDAAKNDTDQWVSMVGDIIKNYPNLSSFNSSKDQDGTIPQFFCDVLADLKRAANSSKKAVIIPLECEYLSKSAMNSLGCHPVCPTKHFTIRRKRKSDILHNELLQKSTEAANNLKRNPSGTTMPIKMRSLAKKMDDNKPMRPLPSSRPTSGGFKTPSLTGRGFGNPLAGRGPILKKEGGTKLLEMNEMPLAPKEAKRRRRIAEQEAAEQLKKDKELAKEAEKQATPDYAAGLMSPATPSPQIITTTTTSTGPKVMAPYSVGLQKLTAITTASSLEQQIQKNLQNSATFVKTPSAQMVKIIPAMSQQAGTEKPFGSDKIKVVQIRPAVSGGLPKLPPGAQIITTKMPSNDGSQKKTLSLTKAQMQEAQEMFKNANKVSRAEKALIIGFMAGCRDNPLDDANQPIINIRLSEGTEQVRQQDGTIKIMGCECYFQMDYKTGTFKRIKKLKPLTQEQINSLTVNNSSVVL